MYKYEYAYMRGEGANEKIHDVLTQVTLSHRGLLQADVPFFTFRTRTVIEKWMEETTNPMMLMQMQSMLSRKQLECLTLFAAATHV